MLALLVVENLEVRLVKPARTWVEERPR